ncbi:MAG: glycosyltransferase [Clostridia bacterium]|nr:glycosyltransferase [Clostridia bacterium]
MRILQINVVYNEKSTGRTCFEVEKYLNAHGDECYTAYGVGDKSSSKYAYRLENKFGYCIHNIFSKLTGLEGYFSLFSTLRLIKYIKKIKPDVIHLRNLHGHFVNLPMLFKYLGKTQTPVVINLHDCWIFTGKCTYPTRTGCDRWKTRCNRCPAKKEYPESHTFDFSKKMFSDKKKLIERLNVKAVIGVSDWVADLAKQSFLNKFKILRLYNWVNRDVFKPYDKKSVLPVLSKYCVDKNKFTVICVAAAWAEDSQKNNEIIDFAEKVGDCQVVVIGRNSQSVKGDNVVYIDFISDIKELAKLYSFADVYVHFSVADTFGKVIAEAMACGTPAVVYDVSACAELVKDGCGEKVEPHNTDGLIAAVRKIKSVGKEFYSSACLKRVEEDFDYNKNMAKLRKIYQGDLSAEIR